MVISVSRATGIEFLDTHHEKASATNSSEKAFEDMVEPYLRRDKSLSVIDNRTLERNCLVRCLTQLGGGIPVTGYDSVEAWKLARDVPRKEVILFHLQTSPASSESAFDALANLVRIARPSPVIVLAATEDLEAMLTSLDCGASAYFHPDVDLEDLIESINVSASGGVILPRNSLPALRQAISARTPVKSGAEAQFTDRQLAVARALQRGAANKMIAYELNLCESTVKVHIRNIMRTLNATNRTQAAFKLNSIIGGVN